MSHHEQSAGIAHLARLGLELLLALVHAQLQVDELWNGTTRRTQPQSAAISRNE